MSVQMPPTILLNAAKLGPSSVNAAAGGVIDLTPWQDWTWADELTFYIVVLGINGSPTGGTGLTAKFQLATPHVTSQNQFSSTALFDLTNAQKGTYIVEGEDWPTPICAYNASVSASSPAVAQRTIRHFGARCNLQLNADSTALTGGTSPTFTVSVVMTAKGK